MYKASLILSVRRGRPRRTFSDQIGDDLEKGQVKSILNQPTSMNNVMRLNEANEVLLTTVAAKEYTSNDTENKESSRTHEIDENESKTLEVNNNIHTNNNSASTNEAEEKLTESSQKVSEKEDIDTASSQVYGSTRPETYEVYENLIDIPDDRTPAGPIVATYTKPPKLNTVKPNSTATTYTGEITTDDKVTEANIKNKKNLLSILHIKFENEDKHKEEIINEVNNITGIFKGFKNYISGLHKGFLNGIHNFFHKKEAQGQREKRSAYGVYMRNENRPKLNRDNVDKTDFFVRQQHISLT